MENIVRISVDLVVHIPEGHRLSIHGMAGLMNLGGKCIYDMNDNTFIVCEDDVFNSLHYEEYNLLGVEYDGHIYEHNAESSIKDNIMLVAVDIWDEYTDYVEMAI